MTVYLEPAHPQFQFSKRERLRSYMIAESVDELHAMAERAGLKKRRWFRDDTVPRYVVPPKARGLVLALGAEALDGPAFRRKLSELAEARRKCVCSKTSCGVYECDHCKKLRPNCCGAYDDVERLHGATCDDCAVSLGRKLDAT